MDAYASRKSGLCSDLLYVIATVATYMSAKLNSQTFEQLITFKMFEDLSQHSEYNKRDKVLRIHEQMYITLESDIMRRLGYRLLSITPIDIAKSL